MRKILAAVLLSGLASGLSACIVATAVTTAADVAGTAVSTTADVAGSAVDTAVSVYPKPPDLSRLAAVSLVRRRMRGGAYVLRLVRRLSCCLPFLLVLPLLF